VCTLLPTLTVSSFLRWLVQLGLFATPNHRYDAWVRLSHSVLNECCADDHSSAHAGFSMKVLDTPGKRVSAPRVDDANVDKEQLTSDLIFTSGEPEMPWPWSTGATMLDSILGERQRVLPTLHAVYYTVCHGDASPRNPPVVSCTYRKRAHER
jgi:hypothetical protein